MNLKLAGGFAIKNLKANRYLEIPFILYLQDIKNFLLL